MPNTKTIRTSFVGGEVAPDTFGRFDLTQEQSGLATCDNFIILPHGPAQNRAGFAYVNALKTTTTKARLIPFSFSNTQTFAIELGAGYFRFHTQGSTLFSAGVPYSITNPYAAADLFDIHYIQSGDVVTFVHPSYPPKELKRIANANWTLTNVSFQSDLTAPAVPAVTVTRPTTGVTEAFTYKVTSLDTYGLQESLPSPVSTSVNNDLSITGNYNTITWTAVAGAVRYNVYKSINGGAFGYIAQTINNSVVDKNFSADLTKTIPQSDVLFSSTDNYPSAVSYFEQRRFFAGTNSKPQNIWASQSGTENNMNYSIPNQDSDALRMRVAAQRANFIRHLIPLVDLIALTASTEWKISSSSGAITASTLSVKPQSQNGASNVIPLVINNAAIYEQSQGGHLREISYQWQANGYQSNDLSLLASHLVKNRAMVDIAFCRAPVPMIWMVNDYGELLGLTYLPEQKVTAWHKHSSTGFYESICIVTEGKYDVLYAIVKRTINLVETRYIERLSTRNYEKLEDTFFVDCGMQYQNPQPYLTALLGTQAHSIIYGYTNSRVGKGEMIIKFNSSYTSAYVGAISGFTVGVVNPALYRVDVYSTSDIDYLQGSSTIDNYGKWAITIAYAGTKTARLVRISDGVVIADVYGGVGLVRSYEVPVTDPVYPYLKERCFMYDQAVALVMAICNNDSSLAGILIDGMMLAIDLAGGKVTFSVSHKSGASPDIYVRNGATAWCLYAMSFYRAKYPADSRTATINTHIDTVATQLLSYKQTTGVQSGLIRGGTGQYSLPDYLVYDSAYQITWCSTEHNIDSWFALSLAGSVRANATYTAAAATVGAALISKLWDTTNNRFYQGMSATTQDTNDALDLHSWGSLFLRAYGDTTKADLAYAGIDDFATTDPITGVRGYRPYLPSRGYPNAGTGVWGEGTLGVILARVAKGDLTKAVAEYDELLTAAGAQGLPYSTLRDYTYELSNWPSVASTAWLIIAAQPSGFWGVSTNITTTIISTSTAILYSSVSTLTGLDYLEKETVSILADGIVHRPLMVNGGSITLDFPAAKISIGLPIKAELKTTPLQIQNDSALGQGRVKNITKVWARCVDYTGTSVGPDTTRLTDFPPLEYELDGVVPKLTNGEFRAMVASSWNADGQVCISHTAPTPLTVVDITIEASIGG